MTVPIGPTSRMRSGNEPPAAAWVIGSDMQATKRPDLLLPLLAYFLS